MEHILGADSALYMREFYKNDDWATVARGRFCNIRGDRHLNDDLSICLIQTWVKKVEETGITLEKLKFERPKLSRRVENLESVNQSVSDDSNLSIRKCTSALNVNHH